MHRISRRRYLQLWGQGLGLAASAALAPSIASANTLRSVYLHSGAQHSRVALHLDASVSYQVQRLVNPDRVVIDLRNITPDGALPQMAGDGIVKGLRAAWHGTDLRLVLDLHGLADPKVHWDGNSLLVDLVPRFAQAGHQSGHQSGHNAAQREVTVLIDAGHGGKDPGAIGPGGTREKDVVLPIANELALRLQATPGIRVAMTRNDDRFLGLRQRLAVARKVSADLFVSVHADAFTRPEAAGSSIYTLSESGASSEAAKWLAAKENAALVRGAQLDQQEDTVASVLLDLVQRETTVRSVACGEVMLQLLGQVNPLHKERVEQAPFAVLKSPDIPSVLVETAFISNPKEEQRLRDAQFRSALAGALHHGIVQYFNVHAPQDSMFAPRG